ncbi:MAG: exonuclease subunit SbcD [Treponemataceae bacterium]|nr:exonuclease subunit SbcD [Treponemataceae bacterium]
MKFLHTSDWHLGKYFFELSLLKDQEHFLNQLFEELQKAEDNSEAYDALLICGDIYDRAVPPPEAVAVFSRFLTKVHEAFPDLHVFAISGNHDSAMRLSFAQNLLAGANIHLCTSASACAEPVILQKNGETVAVYQIPFLTGGAFCDQEDNPLHKQYDLVAAACKNIENDMKSRPDVPAVVCAHLFTNGAVTGDSETSFVGTAEAVPPSLFEPFAYTALGHIHKMQHFSAGSKAETSTVYYSGSPLAYSFGENSDKCFLRVEISRNSPPKITQITVKPLHPVVRAEGTFEELLALPKEEFENCYIEAICTDTIHHENAMGLLKSRFEGVLSYRHPIPAATGKRNPSKQYTVQSEDARNFSGIFDDFVNEIYETDFLEENKEQFAEEKALFLKTAEEIAGENAK